MAGRRKGKKRPAWSGQKRLAAGLAMGLVALVVLSLLLAVPGLQKTLYQVAGITQQPPVLRALPLDFAAPAEGEAQATVHFLDVGQGDAVLLEANGEFALIDAGPPEAESGLLAYLESAGVKSLRYLVMTHPHADHIGSMQAVVEAFSVQQVLLPDFESAPYPTSSLFENLLLAIQEKQLPAAVMNTGGSYPLGGGSLLVLQGSLPTGDNYNLLSPLLLFEYGALRYLSSGDAEKENEEKALESGLDLQANVYKAAHHGSSTSNTLPFMQAVAPQLVVVPCGAGNSYGHPHRGPLENFAAQGGALLRTDQNGYIRVHLGSAGGLQVEAQTAALPAKAA